MKIAFLSSYAHLVLDETAKKTSGGAELQVALLAAELAKRGIEVVILGGDTGQADGGQFRGVRVRNAGNFHTGDTVEMLRSIPRVASILREERPDWTLILGWTAWLFVLWGLRPFFGGKLGFICGLDTEVNGEFLYNNPLRGRLFDFAMRHCDERLAMTRLQERLFLENGMTCNLYRNLILPRKGSNTVDKNVDFLWVSRCQPIKRPLLFLELAKTLPAASFEMICPPENRELFEKVKEAASELPNLTLRESVPYHEIQAHYDAARIFVNTSEWEGWPNSFIQAGQGRTALLSLAVRPDTLFDDFALGFCADSDFDQFLDHAQAYFLDIDLTQAMGQEAERFVAELHNNKKETNAFLRALNADAQFLVS